MPQGFMNNNGTEDDETFEDNDEELAPQPLLRSPGCLIVSVPKQSTSRASSTSGRRNTTLRTPLKEVTNNIQPGQFQNNRTKH